MAAKEASKRQLTAGLRGPLDVLLFVETRQIGGGVVASER